MKKVLLFFVAAAALVLSASCNKGGDNKEVVLPAAKFSAEAKKLELDLKSNKNSGIKSIELTESGRYIVCEQDFETNPLAVKAVAEPNYRYKHGTYKVKDVNVYELTGYATITINGDEKGGQIDIHINGESAPISVTYKVADKYPANDFYTTIARAWNVDKTDISVKFDGKAVGFVKDGCNIPAILKELEQKANVDLKDEDFAGYEVSEINFTMSQTIEIAFTGKDPVAGPITIFQDGKVSYKLQGSNGVEILSGSATGEFNLNPGLGANQIMLTLNTEITTKSGKTYEGTVSFVLSPKAS